MPKDKDVEDIQSLPEAISHVSYVSFTSWKLSQYYLRPDAFLNINKQPEGAKGFGIPYPSLDAAEISA